MLAQHVDSILLRKHEKFVALIALSSVTGMQSEYYSLVLAHMRVCLLGKNDACAVKYEPPQIVLQTLMMQTFGDLHVLQ